ncbi:MAG: Gfo/Idh/MocA family oxidoreductase [Patescibacteria group bacterium]|nr:Gfo/Idh/MocA family oxidoreductase [Patescibacteria group bacterium]
MRQHPTTVSRRRFVKTVAAAAAVPLFVPRHVLGFAGNPGANEQIIVAVVGVGVRGKQLIRNIKNIKNTARIAAVCDCDARMIEEVTQEHQADWKAYEDYRRLIDQRKDLTGLLICTPHHQHCLPGMLACEAGLDVYVEKPLSNYVAEGRALVRAARKYGRVVQVGSQQRTMEMNRFSCELVRDGGIGKVQHVEAVNFGGPIPYPAEGLPEEPIPAGFNWDLFQGPAPARPFNSQLALKTARPRNYFTWRDYSGAGTDMMSHALDMVQYALGADDSGPVEFWPVEGSGMSARIDFRYANGIEVRMQYPAWTKPQRGPHLGGIFVGEKCKIEINRNKFTTNPPDFVKNPPDPQLAEKWEGDGWVASGHIENWFDCIRSREKPTADVEIGHRTVTVGHLINIAREVGRGFRWDPQTERIVGDAEANALLDRHRREGWELPVV